MTNEEEEVVATEMPPFFMSFLRFQLATRRKVSLFSFPLQPREFVDLSKIFYKNLLPAPPPGSNALKPYAPNLLPFGKLTSVPSSESNGTISEESNNTSTSAAMAWESSCH